MNSNYPLGAEFDDNAPWKQINYNAKVIVTLVIEEDFEFNPLISENEIKGRIKQHIIDNILDYIDNIDDIEITNLEEL